MLLLAKAEDFKKYGLPFRINSVYDTSYTVAYDFVPRSFARYYWLDHERHRLPKFSRGWQQATQDWESTTIGIAHFLVEYLTQTSLGEARHFHSSSDAKSCDRCRNNFLPTKELDRIPAAEHMLVKLKSLEEIHTELLHIFWDHTWKFGMGGWLWGNTCWISYKLYEAMKQHNVLEMSKWIDVVSGITHNGGSCLIGKYGFYSYDHHAMNRVLWAKYHGGSCCYQFLYNWAFKGSFNPCEHASSEARAERPVWKAQVLRPGYEAKQLCRKCWIPLPLSELTSGKSLCKTACQPCGTCTCRVIGKTCVKCGQIHKVHYCNDECHICQIKVDKYTPHPICHDCQNHFKAYPFKGAYSWRYNKEIKISLLQCSQCYNRQYVELDDADQMCMIKQLTKEEAIKKGIWKASYGNIYV